MKKTLLTAGILALFSVSPSFGQRVAKTQNLYQKTSSQQAPVQRSCGTQTPCNEWNDWFNAKVEEFKANQQSAHLSSQLTYTIPVIIHVIHNGENVGVGTNISQTQCNSQITVLNADYAGTGLNVGNVPAVFSSLVANTGISFCAAQKDPNGNILAEPGIHRVNRNTAGFTAPPYTQSYIDGTIKPATIWNPANYLNIWVMNLGGGLLGYATFPTGSTLSCLTGNGTTSTDGVVILYNSFGNVGNVVSPYNKGRTATHEIGHWLGLRHIWGDSNCGSDCVADTPPAQTANYGCPTQPYNVGGCTGNTTGEMTMNFMDYTDDACMYMFTPDQTTRIQTCMANGTLRSNLSNASATVCNSTPVAPTAGFTHPTMMCAGSAIAFTDASTGGATSWSWSVSPSAGVTLNTATSQNPTITFPSAGTYSVTLTATNAQGSDPDVQTVTIQACAGGCDTLSNFDFANDTPTLMGSSGFGYVSGHNDYLDKAKADFFAAGTYPTNYRVTQAYYYFGVAYDGGTATSINCKVWNDNGVSGAPSTAFTPSVALPISTIDVTGAGNAITFSPSIDPANGGFYVGFDGLTYNGTTGTFDTVAIITNADGESSPATAWEQWSDNSWHSFNDGTSATWQIDQSLAIVVILCDPTTGVPFIINPTSNVIIYPNPASNTVYVNTNTKKEGTITLKLINMMGQVVATKVIENTTGGTFEMDLGEYGSGIYFMNVSTPEKSVTKKFVVEK